MKCGNKSKIEACIAEATLMGEIADVTTKYYADDVPTLHNPITRYNVDELEEDPKIALFQSPGGKSGAGKEYILKPEEKEGIMFYVLMNMKHELIGFMR